MAGLLSLVIPVYNEADSLEPLVAEIDESLQAAGLEYEIVFVDDGSSDGSFGVMQRLAAHLPGRTAELLDTGCCGMAGAFGMLESKYELSVKVAQPLIEKITHQPYGTITVVSGTSCRHQVQHLATVRTKHMAEVLADALA